jgi:hypothetical protein
MLTTSNNTSISRNRPPGKAPGLNAFSASDWKAYEKNTLRGFVTIDLPSGMRIKECTVHEKNGKRWIGLPGKPWIKSDGTTGYVSILDFASEETKNRWQRLALAAVDDLLLGVHE